MVTIYKADKLNAAIKRFRAVGIIYCFIYGFPIHAKDASTFDTFK